MDREGRLAGEIRGKIDPDRLDWYGPHVSRAPARERASATPLDDPAIRARLLPHVVAEHDASTVVLEELGLLQHRVRVDLAAVNGVLHGYEIKSDRDTLRRLASQVDLYGRVLDFCTVVTGPRLLAKAVASVPSWWGVIVIEDDSPQIEIVRNAERNTGVDPRAQIELLWRDAAIEVLVGLDAARGYRSKPRGVVWDRICELCAADEIAAHVRAHLKARQDLRVVP